MSVNLRLMFLDLVDKVIMQMSTADVAKKLSTVMASDIHQIPLFTTEFIRKLSSCVSPFIFKVYMLPYMSWFDYFVLKQLVNFSGNKDTLEMVDHFVDSLDYSKPILSCDIPEFSQLVVPLEGSCFTILATKHIKLISELTLQDLVDIKKVLLKNFEITEYAVQLAAIHNDLCCFYWLIPTTIRPLIEDVLNEPQSDLWDKGVVLTALLPISSKGNNVQLSVHDVFNISYVDSEDMMKVSTICVVRTYVLIITYICMIHMYLFYTCYQASTCRLNWHKIHLITEL